MDIHHRLEQGFDKLSPNGGVTEDRNQFCAFLICSSTSLALAGIGVPGP